MKQTIYHQAKKLFRFVVYMLFPLAGGGWAGVSCTDTWDDHYDAAPVGVNEGSLWQAIKSNPELSNFASVVEACGYDVALGSSQVFTVFAPTNANFSASDAQSLIAQYKAQKGRVSTENNSTVKEFLNNHIALYNYSVSSVSDTSVVMMNGKYLPLTATTIGDKTLTSKNAIYDNGVLFTIDKKVDYFPNVFEYLSKDADLDSIRNFMYCGDTLYSDRSFPIFFHNEFLPEKSVAGGYENGRTVYLDSVFEQKNELFENVSTLGRLTSEDSTYWMVVPTNAVWRDLITEYEQYFNYHDKVLAEKKNGRDSLLYTNPRLAIVEGTVFSRTTNTDNMLQVGDSAMSTNAVLSYNLRTAKWGSSSLSYYQYFHPFSEGGVFNGTEEITCSNGKVMKTNHWNIDKRQTFWRTRIIEAEGRSSITTKGKSTWYDPTRRDTVESVNVIQRNVPPESPYFTQVFGRSFLECEPIAESEQISVTFNLSNVLSNVPYDIFLSMAPAVAFDSTAIASLRVPTRVVCSLYQKAQNGEDKTYVGKNGRKETALNLGTYETEPDVVNIFKLSPDEGIKFDVCSYGLTTEDESAQVRLKVETSVTSREKRQGTYTRTMRIDAIILIPHVE